jgi:hypothetical protein
MNPMTRNVRALRRVRQPLLASIAAAAAAVSLNAGALAAEPNFPITPQQRSTAQQVAQQGVALSELAPNAPDSYTVKSGDTLWGISSMFLKSPWRWPELWGMNLDQIRNPHLIYPGQTLFLERSGDRARLRMGAADAGGGGTVKLSPRVRDTGAAGAISSVPLRFIEGFLNEAVIFDTDALEGAPRIVATPENRVLLSRGDLAYVRGDLHDIRDWRMYRSPKPLVDPDTDQVLGYEAVYVGSAEYVRPGEVRANGDIVPATFSIRSIKQEANVGDRLAPSSPNDFSNIAPHSPQGAISGRIVSVYGDAVTAGQNQIVALNRGARDGLERGHVLALWRDGVYSRDTTQGAPQTIKLPDERHGLLFVFRVFDKMSYALILNVQEPVTAGDRFTQP